MSITESVKEVRERVWRAAVRSGRSAEDIILVAASKMNSAERVREAFGAGILVFGENRVQEMLEKTRLGAYKGAEIHMIGSLQKNKVRNVVGLCSLIQSVDSSELMEAIAKRAVSEGITQDILIEVNIGREESKSGVMAERLPEILAFASELSGVSVKGLMAIPPAGESTIKARNYFEEMRKLFVDTEAKKYDNVSMKILSMGMSDDFEEAILAGANMVRVGSAIFGERAYPAKQQ